ncbi:MAG TPA: NAD(P)-binding domain-containing protein [Kribbella sp.]|jgi:hypothetical protein
MPRAARPGLLHASEAADRIGDAAKTVDPADFATQADVVVVAVSWEGLETGLSLVGGPQGSLAGKTVLDCTYPVDYETGELKPATGSAAELVARTLAGAHVGEGTPPVRRRLVAVRGTAARSAGRGHLRRRAKCTRSRCGADRGPWRADRCGRRARRLEEAAGFVMRVVVAGHNPRLAVPDVDPAALRTAQATIN